MPRSRPNHLVSGMIRPQPRQFTISYSQTTDLRTVGSIYRQQRFVDARVRKEPRWREAFSEELPYFELPCGTALRRHICPGPVGGGDLIKRHEGDEPGVRRLVEWMCTLRGDQARGGMMIGGGTIGCRPSCAALCWKDLVAAAAAAGPAASATSAAAAAAARAASAALCAPACAACAALAAACTASAACFRASSMTNGSTSSSSSTDASAPFDPLQPMSRGWNRHRVLAPASI